MNYTAHYNKLIARAKARTLAGYSERHHILPRCIGGGNEKENIVRLTAEEHYVAHQLLVKIHPGNKALIGATWMMSMQCNEGRACNKKFGWIRKQYSAAVSERRTGAPTSDATRDKLRLANLGKKMSAASSEKKSLATKGRKRPAERVAATSRANTGKHRSAESRERMRLAAKARPKISEETRSKMRASQIALQESYAIHPNVGKKLTQETRAKMALSQAARRATEASCQLS